MLKALQQLALGAFLTASLAFPALAQDHNWPTPGNAIVPGYVTMCIVANVAVPCPAGGAITAGTTTTSGCGAGGIIWSNAATVACGGNATLDANGNFSSTAAFAASMRLTQSAVEFARLAAPATPTTAAGDYGGGFEGFFIRTAGSYNFTNAALPSATVDTNISRLSAGVVRAGTTAVNSLGTFAAASFRNTGTPPTGNTGTCSTGVTVAGGASAGTWTSTAACALTTGTIILTGMPTQTTGYVCFMSDRTTAGVVVEETATTATSATFTVRALPTGTIQVAANDILQYSCTGY